MEKEYIAGEPQRYEIGGRVFIVEPRYRKDGEIKKEDLWQEVRDKYLEKKNMYLSWQDHNHPSFAVYVEAVNEVYNKYFNGGGWCNVQSIF